MKTKGHVTQVRLVESIKTGEASHNPYLTLYRLRVENTYDDGSRSRVYPYDAVLRKWLDAVTIILTTTIEQIPHVLLRSSLRPPLLLRQHAEIPISEEERPIYLWELPAGLIEPEDKGMGGILRRAAQETEEEAGYQLDPGEFTLLPGAPFVSPGVIPERIWYAHGHIPDHEAQIVPQGDGSPVEDNAKIVWVPLSDAITMCNNGKIEDMKTELGIRRLYSLKV